MLACSHFICSFVLLTCAFPPRPCTRLWRSLTIAACVGSHAMTKLQSRSTWTRNGTGSFCYVEAIHRRHARYSLSRTLPGKCRRSAMKMQARNCARLPRPVTQRLLVCRVTMDIWRDQTPATDSGARRCIDPGWRCGRSQRRRLWPDGEAA